MNSFKWLIRTGYAVALLGMFFVSPLADFLPVDLWASLSQVLKPGEGGRTYYRVVAGERNNILPLVLIVGGVAAVLVGHWLRRRKRGL